MFTLAFIADNISLTRHKICNFPLPIWDGGREQVWLITIILQSSAEAREKVGAVPEGGTVNSPGFEPALLGSDPASGLLSNSVWASVYSSANCGYHLFYWADVSTRHSIIKVERGRHVMGKSGCSPVPCWIGSCRSDPGQYPCTECPLCLCRVFWMLWGELPTPSA